jgi:hypothetical protein
MEAFMLTIYNLVIWGFLALILLPLTISSLISGSPPPPHNMFLAKYYEAEPRLMLTSNLFLLTICATAIHKLADHFGLLSQSVSDSLELWIGVPFFILLVLFLGLFIRAILKVRRANRTTA